MITFVAYFVSPLLRYLTLILFLLTTAGLCQQLWLLLQARQKVLTEKAVPLLWGLVQLVAWDPIEGVLFLKNKALGFCDDSLDDGHGGIRLIYPVLGEELALRVPLETQTLSVTDDNVLTREYLSVMIRGTMKWRIRDIKSFYLLVSRELRSTTEQPDGRLETGARGVPIGDSNPKSAIDRLVQSAITWLRLIAEEQTRIVVSQVSSGLLIAERLKEEIPEVRDSFIQSRMLAGPQGTSKEWQDAANGLASRIEDAVRQRVSKYGISVEEVALQEIRLPQEIVEQCIEACKAAYLPVLAQRKGLAKRAELSVEVELLGREAAATKQIVGAAPNFTLVDFVSGFLAKQMNGPGLGLNTATAGALATSLAAGAAASLPPPSKGDAG
ncbi:MAG TPA: SPFH domain-containing protein [Tepidisphaeraceae bacterium]|jgi:regulator of protease activity HflC (stomatin/prohibitin superfamily)